MPTQHNRSFSEVEKLHSRSKPTFFYFNLINHKIEDSQFLISWNLVKPLEQYTFNVTCSLNNLRLVFASAMYVVIYVDTKYNANRTYLSIMSANVWSVFNIHPKDLLHQWPQLCKVHIRLVSVLDKF